MAIALTAELGKFVSRLRYADLPKDAVPVINGGFADCIGVMIAGAPDPAPQLLKKMLAPAGNEAMVLFGEGRASAPEAAWINGTAAHALDFDDVALRGHPSTVLVPPILAEAEAIGATGEQMVVAYAAGYETWAELRRRDADHHNTKGWHPTAIFGAVCGAAACASLRRLDAQQAAVAIALGASQSAGLVANFGSMIKPFHAGRSSHAGVIAARLAELGYSGAPDALEHKLGFLAAISPGGRIDVESALEAGVDWKLPRLRLTVKKYPTCFYTHRALDGMLALAQAHKIKSEEVNRITVSTDHRAIPVLRNRAPQTGLEAKFSMQFAMACALIAGRAGMAELRDEFVRRPDIQALMQRVAVVPEYREDPANPGYAIYDQVTVETQGGRRLDSGPVTQVRGGPQSPLTRAELWAKFEGCAQVGTARVPARELFDALMALDRWPGARQLPGVAAS